MRTIKADYDDFWSSIGADWYLEDVDQVPEEPDDPQVLPSAILEIRGGKLCWQGKGPCCDPSGLFTATEIEERVADYTTVIRRWLKRRAKAATTVRVLVEIKREDEAALRAWLKDFGGKVLA